MEKITIEFIEESDYNTQEWSGFKVTQGDKFCDGLCYDEMLGLVSSLTMPEKRYNLSWMKSKEQHLKERL